MPPFSTCSSGIRWAVSGKRVTVVTRGMLLSSTERTVIGRRLPQCAVSAIAAEELVAELSAAFLGADLGITAEPRDDHASYPASWLEVLKNDSHAIFKHPRMPSAPPTIYTVCSLQSGLAALLRRGPLFMS